MFIRLQKTTGPFRWFLFTACLFFASNAYAEPVTYLSAADLRHAWAHIKYQLPAGQREEAYARLNAIARRMRMAHPDDVSLWTWEAIILANEAGEKHSLASVQMIKRTKHLIEKSLSLAPDAENSLAYAFLGNLYHEMPGWPIGFGNDARAEYYLRKALAIRPDGLDENYFMGSYLRDKKRFSGAISHLRKAIDALPRPGMEVADTRRKADAAILLNQTMKSRRR